MARRHREAADRSRRDDRTVRSSSTTAAPSTARGSGGSSISSATRTSASSTADLSAWTKAGGRSRPARPSHATRVTAVSSARRTRRRWPGWTRSTKASETGSAALVDARTSEEYANGHIPGAINIPFLDNAEPDSGGHWKSPADLRAMYAAKGVTPDQPGHPLLQHRRPLRRHLLHPQRARLPAGQALFGFVRRMERRPETAGGEVRRVGRMSSRATLSPSPVHGRGQW